MKKAKKILHMIIIGDSLSDRGTMKKRVLCQCIPMSILSGLKGKSPQGRFTNGFVWADIISSFAASDFYIRQIKKKFKWSNEDIVDAVIAKDKRIVEALNYTYNLNNDLYVRYNGKSFIRSYDEGGLTSHSYAWQPSTSVTRFITRIILSTLNKKRKEVLQYDQKKNLLRFHKEHSLVIEWSGANDLITVNKRPSIKEVDLAIKSRIQNVEILIKNGYRSFILFNLPDLSLTPHFQYMQGKKGVAERSNAHECTRYFNQKLIEACAQIKTFYPHCSIDIFDVNSIFTTIYHNPIPYGFDPEKLTQPYIDSDDFKELPNGTSPAKGYFFWDDKHPTADVHAYFADKFYTRYTHEYFFTESNDRTLHHLQYNITEAELIKAFVSRYKQQLDKDRLGFFGDRKVAKFSYRTANLKSILQHALAEKNSRTFKVLKDLQWLDSKGKIKLNIPQLKNTYLQVANKNQLLINQI